jgi:hypothetical protein
MKKTYIIPEVLFVDLINEGIMHSATEPNVGDWVGGKESSEFEEEGTTVPSDLEYDGPKNNLWNDDEE